LTSASTPPPSDVEIAELLSAARNPTAEWLASRFGARSLHRIAEADLPEGLLDPGARQFLTAVGFPAVEIDFIEFESTALHDGGYAQWEFDPDELYGNRTPDEDQTATRFCYTVGTRYEWMIMLDGEHGHLELYDPSGWDHGAGYQGLVASSLAGLAGLLALVDAYSNALADDDETEDEDDDKTRRQTLATLREQMGELDSFTQDSTFWDRVFEDLQY
jgi:hypothetical protein